MINTSSNFLRAKFPGNYCQVKPGRSGPLFEGGGSIGPASPGQWCWSAELVSYNRARREWHKAYIQIANMTWEALPDRVNQKFANIVLRRQLVSELSFNENAENARFGLTARQQHRGFLHIQLARFLLHPMLRKSAQPGRIKWLRRSMIRC